jgi:hypothetical protein
MTMKLLSTLLIFLFGSWIAVPPSSPDPPTSDAPAAYTFHEDSEMTIHGSSNVRDWTMDVLEIDGQVTVQPAASDNGLPTVKQLFVEVPVDSILSGRGAQNEKAHKALQKNAQPAIYFRSESVNVSADGTADATFSVVAEGELIMAGERRTVDVQAEGTRLDDGAYRFQGEYNMLLSDFDIERPTALLGALRVSDEIRVTYDVTIVPN